MTVGLASRWEAFPTGLENAPKRGPGNRPQKTFGGLGARPSPLAKLGLSGRGLGRPQRPPETMAEGVELIQNKILRCRGGPAWPSHNNAFLKGRHGL